MLARRILGGSRFLDNTLANRWAVIGCGILVGDRRFESASVGLNIYLVPSYLRQWLIGVHLGTVQ